MLHELEVMFVGFLCWKKQLKILHMLIADVKQFQQLLSLFVFFISY